MRPETFSRKLQAAIDRYRKRSCTKLFTPALVKELERQWRKAARRENDYRCGFETYGYYPFEITAVFDYICDRWNCAYRMRWIADGLHYRLF